MVFLYIPSEDLCSYILHILAKEGTLHTPAKRLHLNPKQKIIELRISASTFDREGLFSFIGVMCDQHCTAVVLGGFTRNGWNKKLNSTQSMNFGRMGHDHDSCENFSFSCAVV